MADGKFAVVKTDAEWKSLLAPDAYRVLRKSSTEPAGAGKYNKFFPKEGHFSCGGCGFPLYDASAKFNDCGWIAFDKCYHSGDTCHVGVRKDFGGLETICAQCGGHLGHVFYGEGHTETNERH